MPADRYDVLIVGCGIAGASLAWHLHWAGHRLIVIDDPNERSNASRAAAGLISPLSGQRHTATPGFEEYWSSALTFYRRVEAQPGARLLTELPQLRFFADEVSPRPREYHSPQSTTQNKNALDLRALSTTAQHELHVEIDSAALDVNAFLDVTFEMLDQQHRLLRNKLNYADLSFNKDGVTLNTEQSSAEHIVFCEGWQGQNNPWFKDVAFESVRGETLRIMCPDLPATYIYHRKVSLVPTHTDGEFIVGATYDRDNLTQGPTTQGEQQLTHALNGLLSTNYTLATHSSGVRPVIKGRLPLVERHPTLPQCWFFNGLASRGCLQAPLLAARLSRAIVNRDAFPEPIVEKPADDNALFVKHTHYHSARLTSVAHQLIKACLHAGDIAIDATAGNGNDTLLLANIVTLSGRIYAFDIQDAAIDRTKTRLGEARHNVQMIKQDHAQMPRFIPQADHGQIAVVVFNLGYLPGGQKHITTNAQTSCAAISSALKLLRARGHCLILCYRGHPGGEEETIAISKLLAGLNPNNYRVEKHLSENSGPIAPVLFRVEKCLES